MQSPPFIVLISKPGIHRIFYDGTLHYTGCTEIDCARYLKKYIHGWPDSYSMGSFYGSGHIVYAEFIRSV